MENPDKAPRLEAKLQNLDDDQHQVLWDLRYKDDAGTKINKSIKAIQAEVPIRYGFTVARSTVSIFFAWLKSKREWEADVAAANQFREDYRRDKPDATTAELMEVGQIKFMARTMQRGDDKGFVRLMRAITAWENSLTARAKAKEAEKGKVEAGLEALFAEVKGNPAAEAAFRNLEEILKQA